MAHKTFIILLLLFLISKNEMGQNSNYQNSNKPTDCKLLRNNSDIFWFLLDSPRYNNYTQHYQYLYCKYFFDTTSTEEIQDYNIFGMYQEVEAICDTKYRISKVNSLTTINLEAGDLQDVDSFISKNAHHKIIIYNDDHTRMEPRAFFLSKLALYRKLGFTYLAMEAFQNVNEEFPSFVLGYYFQEPIMAEIFREAKRLGYKLIQYESYEDDRMDGQAQNLYQHILQLNDTDKILVFAEQTNLAEDIPKDFRLLGSILKNELKIDPLTIDLTRGIKSPQSIDVVFNKQAIAGKSGVVSSKKIREQIGFGFVDYFYIFPDYKYQYDRPEWLKCGTIRKHFPYKSKNKNSLLIQVYYENELIATDALNYITPADMVNKLDKNGVAHFYLRPKTIVSPIHCTTSKLL